MFIGTHAGLPVILAGTANLVSWARGRRQVFKMRHLAAIAVGGVLPDVVWPHLSLHARLTSWSHTVWFLVILIPVLAFAGRRLLGKGWKPAAAAVWLAVVLHLAVDTISGGTSPLYPLGDRIGMRTVPFHSWILVDLVTVPLAILAFAWTHRKAQSGTGESDRPNPFSKSASRDLPGAPPS